MKLILKKGLCVQYFKKYFKYGISVYVPMIYMYVLVYVEASYTCGVIKSRVPRNNHPRIFSGTPHKGLHEIFSRNKITPWG